MNNNSTHPAQMRHRFRAATVREPPPFHTSGFLASQGTVTVVIQAVGKTTIEMATLREGDFILDFIGPLGLPSHIRELDGTVVLVGGGLGVAPILPQLREYKNAGNRTIVSLNSIMVDGTGMCGSCRVTVDGKIKFACVGGADFDGHLVNLDELALRQKRFEHEEKAALERYRSESALLASLKMPAESGGRPPASTCELPQPTAVAPGPLVPKNIRSIPPERAPMPEQPPEVRRHNFSEVTLGLDLEAAVHEAQRCLRCKKPRCVQRGDRRFRPGRPGLRRRAGAERRQGDHFRGAAQ